MTTPCNPTNAYLFDPDSGTEANAEAMRLCATCPMRDACAEQAVELKAWGIWGGKVFIEGKLAHLAPRIVEYTVAEQKDAHRRYALGERETWIVDANRAYHQAQRDRKRAQLTGVDALLAERFGDVLSEAS